MRRLILLFVVLAVAASGCTDSGTDASDRSGDTSEPTETQPENNTVFYTDSGFEPQRLEIQQGETITWLDRSSQDMWVAVDRHPTHTNYDGTSVAQHCDDGDAKSGVFDQCSSGKRYSFTFEKTGEWSYHNHEYARDSGTVVVN